MAPPNTPLDTLLMRTIGANRMRDASARHATSTEPLLYHVSGGEEPHWVNLVPLSCDCEDFQSTDLPCKHIGAVLRAINDFPLTQRVLEGLGERPAGPAPRRPKAP